jgi:hypothetical protein
MPFDIPGVIRRTGLGLFIRVACFTFLCFVLASVATVVGGTFWVFLAIFWLPGFALALVFHRARLTIAGDVLTYRVPLRTTRAWRRGEIAAFWLQKTWWSRGASANIRMETVTGEQVTFWAIDASLRVERSELDRWLAMLQDWLEAAV